MPVLIDRTPEAMLPVPIADGDVWRCRWSSGTVKRRLNHVGEQPAEVQALPADVSVVVTTPWMARISSTFRRLRLKR